MAIGLNSDVLWLTDDGGQHPGIVIQGGQQSPVFPGEFRWLVRLVSGQQFWLEGRDLQETTLTGANLNILRGGGAMPALVTTSPVLAAPAQVPVLQATAITTQPGAQTMQQPLLPANTAPGADLRDITGSDGVLPATSAVGGAIVPVTQVLARLGPVAAVPIRGFFARFAAGVQIAWSQLPQWVRAVLIPLGITGGALLMDDVGAAILPSGDGAPFPIAPGGAGGLPQVQIVGQWVANGVVFYRLADGRLAVQNKKGRWRVWRPKKPIVLYATGATDLKTLLRADAVLDRQAKKIRTMLNRRAPRAPRGGQKKDPKTVVIAQDGSKVIDV